MDEWEEELLRLFDAYMALPDEECSGFTDYLETHASKEYLEMSEKAEKETDELRKQGILV